jgi:hypothetical protein
MAEPPAGGSAIVVLRKAGAFAFSCQVAEHGWDPVGQAIVTYAYRFKSLSAAAVRRR